MVLDGGGVPALISTDLGVNSTGRVLYASTTDGIYQFCRSYRDVPDSDPYWSFVDSLVMNGITAGCWDGNFCPQDVPTRAQAAVLLLRAEHGASYEPPLPTGTLFRDVPDGAFGAAWIEQLASEGISSGCGGGNFCPGEPLTRSQAAVFLLRALYGSTFVPPPATGLVFRDVAAGDFAAAWIEQLAAEGITAGCGAGNYCPEALVTRAQIAALLVTTFDLR